MEPPPCSPLACQLLTLLIMARPLRINVPDGIYHVTSRGLERRSIVSDDLDRRQWTDLLGRVASRRNWRFYAWALMNNHYHLFLRVPHADLSEGMHDLNSAYVSVYNRRHRRCGPLLQGRLTWNRYGCIMEPKGGLRAKPDDQRHS